MYCSRENLEYNTRHSKRSPWVRALLVSLRDWFYQPDTKNFHKLEFYMIFTY